MFELHAGSANKRPPEYIYLENGNTLRDVMNACLNASLDTLDEFVRNAIGCTALKKSSICLNCRGCFFMPLIGYSVHLHACVFLEKNVMFWMFNGLQSLFLNLTMGSQCCYVNHVWI